ncbi:leucine-rich repeat serine/threonine-protein kinase 1 [Striga asiatica]|uniref:Leucine-rich repeat serine/threonine-protein kinase 1 n=1 Tax=Striga asiatica TaxID=4170 RepID=A0A5A7QMY9_STRAF|nr:leucine-rich repeat serine/threonine-protein kinase 1 [Striga asiatica]
MKLGINSTAWVLENVKPGSQLRRTQTTYQVPVATTRDVQHHRASPARRTSLLPVLIAPRSPARDSTRLLDRAHPRGSTRPAPVRVGIGDPRQHCTRPRSQHLPVSAPAPELKWDGKGGKDLSRFRLAEHRSACSYGCLRNSDPASHVLQVRRDPVPNYRHTESTFQPPSGRIGLSNFELRIPRRTLPLAKLIVLVPFN